jgi:hypothetical protein
VPPPAGVPEIKAALKPAEKQSEPLAPATGTGGSTAPQSSALANVGSKPRPTRASVQAYRAAPSLFLFFLVSHTCTLSIPHKIILLYLYPPPPPPLLIHSSGYCYRNA